MNIRMITGLGVALFAGGGAYFLASTMTSNSSGVQIIEPIQEQTVRVLIATRDLQRGERLNAEDINWAAWPKKAVQPTFITEETLESREELQNAVARSLIVTGEPIIDAKIVKADDSGLMAAILSPGMRAVTMRVSPETASGGFILPGDKVDVFHTAGGSRGAETRLLFEDVKTLAVNTIYSQDAESAHIDGANVTLELSPGDAAAFTTARAEGSLSLVLRSIFKPEGGEEPRARKSNDVQVIRYGSS